jgi:hypothetical protein
MPPSPCSATTDHPRNLRDRHALRPAQPSDLSPVLHDQHLLAPCLDSGQGHGEAGQFQVPHRGQYSVAADIAGVFDGLNIASAWREYRRLARLLHPDTGSDHDVFIELGVG